MTFQAALNVEFGKHPAGKPVDKTASKRALVEAYKKSPPDPKEREEFIKKQSAEGKELFLDAEKDAKLVKVMPKDKKAMLGLGAGAAVLLFLGAPILLPIAAAGGAGYYFVKLRKGCMTPERQKIYESALKDLKDPVKLKTLADEFEKEGCTKEADLLRKRAALRELPKEKQVARRKVFKAALKSTNVHGVEDVASAFEGEGATGAAEALRIHAAALRNL